MKKYIPIIFVILILTVNIQAKPVNEDPTSDNIKSGDFENDGDDGLKTAETEAESKESMTESAGMTKRESDPNTESEQRSSFTEANHLREASDNDQTKDASNEAAAARSASDQLTESKTAESESDTDTPRSGDVPLIDNRRLVREKSSDGDDEADLSEASKSAGDTSANDEERSGASAADDNDESRDASNESDRNFPDIDEPKEASVEERADFDNDDSDSENVKAATRRMLSGPEDVLDSKARADDSSQSETVEVSRTGEPNTERRSSNPFNPFDSRSNFGSEIIIPQLRPTFTRSGVFYRPSLLSVQSLLPTPNRFGSHEFNSKPSNNYKKPEPHRTVSSHTHHLFDPVNHVSNAYPYLTPLTAPQFTTPKPAHSNPAHVPQFSSKDVDNVFLKLAQASEKSKPHNFIPNRRSFESFTTYNNDHVSNLHQYPNKFYNSFDPNYTASKVYDTYRFKRGAEVKI